MISHLTRERVGKRYVAYAIITMAFFFFLFILSFSRSMNKAISHDEYQFVASGQLFAERGFLPYRDYPFLHMPYIAFINAFTAILSSYDLLAARSFNALMAVFGALLIFYLGLLILKNAPGPFKFMSSLLAAFLYTMDPVFIITDGRALNHAIPTLLSLAAFAFFIKGNGSEQASRMNFYSGLFVGLAIGVRLSYAVQLIAYSLVLFIYPFDQTIRSRLRNILIFDSGVFLGLLPVMILFLLAPNQFIYGNYIYPRLNPIYRLILLNPEVMTVAEKAKFFSDTVLNNPVDILIYSIALFYSFIVLIRLIWFKDRMHIGAVLAASLGLMLFLTAFVPTPAWPQYYFAPLPFLVILLLYALSEIQSKKPLLSTVLVISTFVIVVFNRSFSEITSDIAGLRHPEDWQPVQVHKYALKIQALVSEGKVLTLAPIVPLEVGLDTYEMFAVGPFSWRTAHLLGEEKRRDYQVVSYKELEDFLSADPPDAILIGVEATYEGFQPGDDGGLERPFLEYAIQSEFKPIEFPTDFAGLPTILYVRDSNSGEH